MGKKKIVPEEEVDMKYYTDKAISLVGTKNIDLVEKVEKALIGEFRRGMRHVVEKAHDRFAENIFENIKVQHSRDN